MRAIAERAFAVAQTRSLDARGLLLRGIMLRRFDQTHRERITRHLLRGRRQRVEIRCQTSVEQRQIAHVLQARAQQLRCHPTLLRGAFLVPTRARFEEQLLHTIDGQVLVRAQLASGALVQPGHPRQLAQNEVQRLG